MGLLAACCCSYACCFCCCCAAAMTPCSLLRRALHAFCVCCSCCSHICNPHHTRACQICWGVKDQHHTAMHLPSAAKLAVRLHAIGLDTATEKPPAPTRMQTAAAQQSRHTSVPGLLLAALLLLSDLPTLSRQPPATANTSTCVITCFA